MVDDKARKRVLISGGGIAGLTLGILLSERDWEPLVVERDPMPSTEGYMMDFFGTGWDVAERIGIVEDLRAVKYPMEYLEYVDNAGRPYASVSVNDVRRALGGNYVRLRRSDLEAILSGRAKRAGVIVRFGTTIRSLEDTGSSVKVEFEGDSSDSFSLVVGADGVHSRVRELAFGPEERFARYLGAYVAAFQAVNKYGLDRSLKMFEQPGQIMGVQPLSHQLITVFYIFRSPNPGFVPIKKRLPFLRERFRNSGWIAAKVLEEVGPTTPIFLDPITQIVMPSWSSGRIVLTGDACACLTPFAGQGSHLAMGGAFVIARELERSPGDHRGAFDVYEHFLRPITIATQHRAARFLEVFVPGPGSNMWLRRLVTKLVLNRLLIGFGLSGFGAGSILRHYK